MFVKPVEFSWFTREFQDVYGEAEHLSMEDTRYLLSFDCLFAPFLMIRGFLYDRNNMTTEFKESFVFQNPKPILHYLRYIFIEFFLQGLRLELTVQELLMGFQHPFLTQFRHEDPSTGLGDPSIPE
jgi:hypothetical protein